MESDLESDLGSFLLNFAILNPPKPLILLILLFRIRIHNPEVSGSTALKAIC
jgi:hypothetical protein